MASVDVELKVLCLQSRAAEEASERAKQEKLAAGLVSANDLPFFRSHILYFARAEAEEASRGCWQA